MKKITMSKKTKNNLMNAGKTAALGFVMKQIYDKRNQEYIYDTFMVKIGENYHVTDDKASTFNATIQWIKNEVNNRRINLYINSYPSKKNVFNGEKYSIEEGNYKLFYKKCMMVIDVRKISKANNTFSYKININFIGSNAKTIKNELVKYINNEIEIIKANNVNSTSSNGKYIEYIRVGKNSTNKYIASRQLNTIFSDQLEDIIKILEEWGNQKQIYKEHDLPFKTGILLHGKPGTGKTSIIKAIASYFDMKLININLATISVSSLEKLNENISGENELIMLEEIDLGIGNGLSEEKEQKIQLLLTLLDGIECRDNVIFIATTNYLDKIDERIKRSGRFDNIIEIKNISRSKAVEMCKSFKIEDPEIILSNEIFKSEDFYNPSDLQNIILKYITERSKIQK